MSEVKKVYCLIRKEWVTELPEEIVRQRVLQHMLQNRDFPPALIVVEKALKQLPHLACVDPKLIPDRRADIISFGKGIHPHFDLHPLLVVECKAVKLTPKVIKQAVGYNHFVQAAFICLANQEKLITGWYDASKGEYVFVEDIPGYFQLVQSLKAK